MTEQTEKRLLLLAWPLLCVALALEPLQWRDPNRLLYVAAGLAIAVALAIRCLFQWNKPKA
jgi:hypothetical protein